MKTKSPVAAAVTAREREVWLLVAAHLTNRQIADELCVSVRTVESHVSSLIRKMNVTDRRSLARKSDRATSTAQAHDRPRWPATITSFVGREAEREALRAAVGAHRLVTVTGPGGVGKTRLALDVVPGIASSRRDGAWFVDLVQVTDPAMVIATVASMIGVDEQQGTTLTDAVVAALVGRDALIVLDNCEHVLDAVRSFVEHLLMSCPSLSMMATSRTRLVVPFEWVYAVPGMSVTDDGGDAVSLFVERAAATGSAEPLDPRRIAVLCRALDGMALAIELAAARAASLGLEGLIDGLDQPLRFLTSGSLLADRHRSMRDAIAWSADLLTADERALLFGVSAFASWFDVDSATIVAAPSSERAMVADTLGRLTEHNLLVASPGQPICYRALETIRQYAVDQLERGAHGDEVFDRHRRWCHDRLATLAGEQRDQAWCDRLDGVIPDAVAAITRAVTNRLRTASAHLCEDLADQLFLRGQPSEAQRRYEQAALHSSDGLARPRLLRLAAGAAATRLAGNDVLRLLEAAATHAHAAGDCGAAAADLAWMVIYLDLAPGILAELPRRDDADRWLRHAQADAPANAAAEATVAAAMACELSDADPDVDELVAHAIHRARAADAPLVESAALDRLCAYRLANWNLAGAIDVVRRRGEVLGAVQLDAASGFQFNDYLVMASEVHLAVGDLTRAADYAHQLAHLDWYREYDFPAIARSITVDAIAGNFAEAVASGEKFLRAWDRAGRPVARTLTAGAYAMTMVHGVLADEDRRSEWFDVAATLYSDGIGLAGCTTGWSPTLDALVALDQGRPDEALERLAADIDDAAVWRRWQSASWRPWYAALWAEAAVLTGDPDADSRLGRASDATAENAIASTIVQRARDLARGDVGAVQGHVRSFAELGCRYQQHRTQAILDHALRT